MTNRERNYKIKIPITPSQKSIFQNCVEEINRTNSMLMQDLVFGGSFVAADIFDVSELLAAADSSEMTEIDKRRFRQNCIKILTTTLRRSRSHRKISSIKESLLSCSSK